MGHTNNSILINAPYDKVFDISNDIERWTELFGEEYKEAKILKREGNKLTFCLTDNENRSWQSFRLLFKEHYFAYAQKLPPEFPFKYMKIIWLYTLKSEGVLMTWIQDFEMDEKAKFNDSQVEEMINKHSRENLNIFKRIIENEAKK
ncbi:MAG: SRPBCC family protein [Candidatus Omnitrophota bacterium]|nr:SRPBCC family protein [Candidatus Omnitrophota bacterium]